MKKWVAIIIIVVLVVVILGGGYYLWQQTDKLTEARAQVASLEGDVSSLRGDVSSLRRDLAASQAEVSSLQGKLTASEATVTSLRTDLSTANATIKSLDADLFSQRTTNSSLSAELKKVQDPKHFATVAELIAWITKDDTNTKYASESQWQKTFILQVRALRDGYLLPVIPMIAQDGSTNPRNMAVIGDWLWVVNASDDSMVQRSTVQPLPSHPLPLP